MFKCFAKITTEDEIYEGEFLNGKRDGEGILNYTDSEFYGNSYQGQFLNDKYHGEGVYKYVTGDYYEGNFRMGRFDGFGIFYYKSGEEEGDVYGVLAIWKRTWARCIHLLMESRWKMIGLMETLKVNFY